MTKRNNALKRITLSEYKFFQILLTRRFIMLFKEFFLLFVFKIQYSWLVLLIDYAVHIFKHVAFYTLC
jgi:hypothetical protein